MKLAYHGATSMKSSLETDVQVSAKAGFTALELWAAKVDTYLTHNSIDRLKKLSLTMVLNRRPSTQLNL
jgi:hypothetical protein